MILYMSKKHEYVNDRIRFFHEEIIKLSKILITLNKKMSCMQKQITEQKNEIDSLKLRPDTHTETSDIKIKLSNLIDTSEWQTTKCIKLGENIILNFEQKTDSIKIKEYSGSIKLDGFGIEKHCVFGNIVIYNKDSGTIHTGIIEKNQDKITYILSNRPLSPLLTKFSGTIKIEIIFHKI